MKKLIITLSIIAMLGVIYPGLPISAQPVRVPHENPENATGLPDKVGLLLSYIRVINLAGNSRQQDARDLLNELKHADVPDDVQLIINQYNEVWQSLFSTLGNLEALLDEASGLLANNQIYELRQKFNSADNDIKKVYTLLNSIDTATNSLCNKLGVFSASATSQLNQAHKSLEESQVRLDDLVNMLEGLHQKLSEQYIQKEQLISTEVSLSIDPESAYVGDIVTASGKLIGDGSSLIGKTVSLTADNYTLATAITKLNGLYTAAIELPYKYDENMTVNAVYSPASNDVDSYLACISPPVAVTTEYYQTVLEASVPLKIYRGLPFTVSGEVTSDNDNIPRSAKVLLDNTLLTTETISGRFSFEIMPPDEFLPGQGKLAIDVSPQGRYAGASAHSSISVSLLPINIDTRIPSVILTPGDIEISGIIYSELGPVMDAEVNLKLDDASVAATSRSDGGFQGTIKSCVLPDDAPPTTNPFYVSSTPTDSTYDFSPIGIREITITADTPQSPGFILEVKRQIITINPLSLGLILAILAALWLFVRRRSRTLTHAEAAMTPVENAVLPKDIPMPVKIPGLTGIGGQVLSTYRSVLAVVEKFSGVIMSPDTTLREFLTTASLPSPIAAAHFAELTDITENALYSARSPKKDTAARAEKLAFNINEELGYGTP